MANKKVLIGTPRKDGAGSPAHEEWTTGDTPVDPDGNPMGGSGISPIGSVTMFAGAAVPAGWLDCDGSVVAQATYPALFAAIGTNWDIGGEGAGNFRLPDLRGRSPVGVGAGAGLTPRALAATGGEENHQLTTAELASHAHPVAGSISDPTFTNQIAAPPGLIAGATTTSATGGDTAHNTMHPFRGVYFIIKA